MSEVVDRENIRRRLTDMSAFWQYRIDSWRADGATSGTEKRHAQQFWSRGSEVQLIMLRGEAPVFSASSRTLQPFRGCLYCVLTVFLHQ